MPAASKRLGLVALVVCAFALSGCLADDPPRQNAPAPPPPPDTKDPLPLPPEVDVGDVPPTPIPPMPPLAWFAGGDDPMDADTADAVPDAAPEDTAGTAPAPSEGDAVSLRLGDGCTATLRVLGLRISAC